MTTWRSLWTPITPGSWESAVVPVAFSGVIASGRILWDEVVPPGTTLLMERRIVDTEGTEVSPYAQVSNNVDAAGLNKDFLTGYGVQLRATLNAPDEAFMPAFRNVRLNFTPAYFSTGEWLSPVLDTSDLEFESAIVTSVKDATFGTVEIAFRSKFTEDEPWRPWAPQTEGADMSSKSRYNQLRVTLTPDAGLGKTPTFTSTTIPCVFKNKSGWWQSDVLDVTNASDKNSCKIIVNMLLGPTGQLIVFSRSRASVEQAWSSWYVSLQDGTLTHPPANHVQLGVQLFGSTEVQELTFSVDGVPSANIILSGMTPGAGYDFTTLKDTLIIVNGADAPRKWDAVKASPELLGGNPPAFRNIETHQNRLWGVEVENPSRLRCSDILVPETWPAFNYFDFNPEDGDEITALGRYGQNLMVSKQRSMAMVTGNSFSNYSITWMDFTYGATGPRAMCATDKYLAYVAVDGIRFTDLVTSILATERMKPDWEKLNLRRLNQAAMIYHRNLLLVALPSKNSLVNDTVFAYDTLRNAWTIYKGWCVSAWATFQQYGDVVLLASDSLTGQVYEVFTGDADDGQAVNYTWRTREMDFKYPERYKLFRNIFIDVEGLEGGSSLSVRMYVDGEATPKATVSYSLASGEQKSLHIMPPVHDVILGRTLTLEFVGTALIKSYVVEYSIKGTIPQEDV